MSKSIALVQTATDETRQAAGQVTLVSESLFEQGAVLQGLRVNMTNFILEMRKTG